MSGRRKKPRDVAAADWRAVASPAVPAALMAKMRPAAEVVPDVVAGFKKARGRPRSALKKVPVTIRLDPDVVAAFKAGGAGWQTRINRILAAFTHREDADRKSPRKVKSVPVRARRARIKA
jgi:uncharacterized protein (DUF4415 family)